MTTAALLALALAALLADAGADTYGYSHTESDQRLQDSHRRDTSSIDQDSQLSGCLYDGRWHASGATFKTREQCLQCVCVRSALSCQRRACTSLIDPPPKHCHIRHRPDACCPELVCPDGIVKRDYVGNMPLKQHVFEEVSPTVASGTACVERGTVYAAGSAMSSSVACEQCFCLKGAKKCVRPTCLPTPPNCVSKPTAGACCPQRYYCEHNSPLVQESTTDCEVDGKRIQEGERVSFSSDCTACFCLKGAVRCQPLGCAPPLHGCQPILRPGECCAHKYKCDHPIPAPTRLGGPVSHLRPMSYNSIMPTRNDNRALHVQKWAKAVETSTNKVTTDKPTYTVKVKRKTTEATNDKPDNETQTHATRSKNPVTVANNVTIVKETITEQPEKTVKVVINGTINCTTELSSTSLPLSIPFNETDTINILPRIPIVNGVEAQTYSPDDIITDRSVLGDFDENDTFTINVTSSLNGNSNSSIIPIITTGSKKPTGTIVKETVNNSKPLADYDYDYKEPTLPPSLPNLKIIPFLAADAVVDDDSAKDIPQLPILERDDKYPVYYAMNSKDSHSSRREDVYNPTAYPVFAPGKVNDYEMDVHEDFPGHLLHYTVSTALKNRNNDDNAVTKASVTSPTYGVENPAVNLFSPPTETEGGFIPKAPGIAEEYYTLYSSTPTPVAVPHLTTSMQLDIPKGDCVTDDGQRVPEGGNTSIDCNQCLCSWGHLRCAPFPCRAPPGCYFKEADGDSENQCCGDVVCIEENKTSTVTPVTKKVDIVNHKRENTLTNITREITLQTSPLNGTSSQNHVLSPYSNATDKQPQDKFNATIQTKPTPSPIATATKLLNNIELSSKAAVSSTTQNSFTRATTTVTPLTTPEANDTSSEYEDEEEEGFSFGSVLKLLLSDSYDTTTKYPIKKPVPTKPPISTPPDFTSTRRPPASVNQFIPLPAPFIPPKIGPSTVNRIDHLVLGEATAIKRTTTKKPAERSTERPIEITTERHVDKAVTPGLRPPSFSGLGSNSPGIGPGLLKLAGCNIYGRIYRVGRIIAELSTPCLECWCVEIGVECKKLDC